MTQPSPLASIIRPVSSIPSRGETASILLGPSAAMALVWAQLRRLAPHVRCLLLTGEADCGQEAVARVLLELSPQRQRPFLTLSAAEIEARLLRHGNLSSLPLDAFLFLPDIDRSSAASQAALLQLMRQRRSRPFAVVACAREELRSLVSVGRFSPELADALGSVRVAIPALRQRIEDLPMLLNHLLSTHGAHDASPAPRLGDSFVRAAMQHTWPGNLGELTRVVHALLQSRAADAQREELSAADLAASLKLPGNQGVTRADAAPVRLVPLDTILQEHICAVLRACRGNKLRASEVLGISRSTLYRMLDAAALQNSSLSLAN